MNNINKLSTLAVSALLTSGALAGEVETPVVAPAPESRVSGTLDLAYNTHFISYGLDVWGAGTDFGSDGTFNPSINLDYAITDALTFSIGTWMDINNNATDTIGGDLQEVDFWAGLGYTAGSHSFSLTGQSWVYGSEVEQIIDLGYGYDHWLNPSLLAHFRVSEGASGGNNGVFFVLGVAPGTDYGKLSLSFPVAVAATPDDFHGGDSGFGYASAGVQASYPLPGDFSLNAGLTGYLTNDEVTLNADENFITGNVGVSIDF
ncbi:hypothetical protein [Rubritalea marina]|uniref:hypothetical protein n=1 Tax=Rubritalea marina TaxID=361055 RepID=UPI00037119A6|nr:hypothetical protein [Rubritalea marina]